MIKVMIDPAIDGFKPPEDTHSQLLCNCTNPTFSIYTGNNIIKIVCTHCKKEQIISHQR